jgi:hypothetical protein
VQLSQYANPSAVDVACAFTAPLLLAFCLLLLSGDKEALRSEVLEYMANHPQVIAV